MIIRTFGRETSVYACICTCTYYARKDGKGLRGRERDADCAQTDILVTFITACSITWIFLTVWKTKDCV